MTDVVSSPVLCEEKRTLIVLKYNLEVWIKDSCSAKYIQSEIVPKLGNDIPAKAKAGLGIPENGYSDGGCGVEGICDTFQVKTVVDEDTGECTESYARPDSDESINCTPINGYMSIQFDPCKAVPVEDAMASAMSKIEELIDGGNLNGMGNGCVIKAVYVDRSSPAITTLPATAPLPETPPLPETTSLPETPPQTRGSDRGSIVTAEVVMAETASTQEKPASSMPIGAIVGIVVSLLALFAVIALLVRRRKLQNRNENSGPEKREIGEVDMASAEREEGVEIFPEMDEIDRIVASVDTKEKCNVNDQDDPEHNGGMIANNETFVSEDGSNDSDLSANDSASSNRSTGDAGNGIINSLNLSVGRAGQNEDENFELFIA